MLKRLSFSGLLTLAGLFFPLMLFAQTAGFADSSVWVLPQNPTEGQTATIYATLSNGGTSPVSGTVVFKDGTTTIGSSPFTLKSGGATIVSIPWKPSAGARSVYATIESTAGGVAGAETASVTVVEKPKTKMTEAAKLENPNLKTQAAAVPFSTSDDIQEKLQSFSPKAADQVKPVFSSIDSWRKTTAQTLDVQAAQTQAKVGELTVKKASLAKQEGDEAKSESRNLTFMQIAYTILLYLYTIFLYLISKAGIFYPFLAALFFFGLYKLYQRFTKPTYEY